MNLGLLMCVCSTVHDLAVIESVCERPGFALCMKKGGIRFSKSFRGGAAQTLTASEVLIRGVWLPLKRKFVPGRNNSPGVEGTHTIISWAGFNHGPLPSCSVFPVIALKQSKTSFSIQTLRVQSIQTCQLGNRKLPRAK